MPGGSCALSYLTGEEGERPPAGCDDISYPRGGGGGGGWNAVCTLWEKDPPQVLDKKNKK